MMARPSSLERRWLGISLKCRRGGAASGLHRRPHLLARQVGDVR